MVIDEGAESIDKLVREQATVFINTNGENFEIIASYRVKQFEFKNKLTI